MFIKLAWRNILRNKRRTFIAGIAIGIGLTALIFTDALIIGMEKNMIQAATSTFLGDAQIHQHDFRTAQDVALTINRLDSVLARLEKDKLVAHFTLRTTSFAMITSPANVQAITLIGVVPETEKHLSKVDDAISKGTFFTKDPNRALIIGSELADILKVGLDDRVVITVAQAGTGDLSQEMFRISGIFHSNVEEMDQGMAFATLAKAQSMLGIGSGVHEIAIQFTDMDMALNDDLPFWREYSRYGNKAISWAEILPQMEAVLALSNFSTLMVAVILFGVVALGIINTLFMSIHERTFEFGVIRAIGTRPFNVAKLILLEAGALALISIVIGDLLGLVITYLTAQIGIDYTGIEIAGVTFQKLLYPVLEIDQFITYPFWVFVFTILVGIYPAIHAAKMKPADALRRTI